MSALNAFIVRDAAKRKETPHASKSAFGLRKCPVNLELNARVKRWRFEGQEMAERKSAPLRPHSVSDYAIKLL